MRGQCKMLVYVEQRIDSSCGAISDGLNTTHPQWYEWLGIWNQDELGITAGQIFAPPLADFIEAVQFQAHLHTFSCTKRTHIEHWLNGLKLAINLGSKESQIQSSSHKVMTMLWLMTNNLPNSSYRKQVGSKPNRTRISSRLLGCTLAGRSDVFQNLGPWGASWFVGEVKQQI